ncbi:hypothetical protein [Chryseobacterium viscerum]|uniref:Uncharacterized protein n=1 Tax=Chryseobacterium viscerum TaxID=1037377 RepID=A0A316WG66_9FLAO|nr:hypothetical protein [Chryseobacterium viscerum]PWN60444.1 hypothetical protein C1634_015995 [Chryseobacterium viscerum]
MKRKFLFTACLLGVLYTGNAQSNTSQNGDVDPFASYEDKTPSWKGEKVDVDKYYDIQPDGSYIRKDIDKKKQNTNTDNTTVLIIVILFVGIGIIGAIVTSQRKPNNYDRN